jgi:two-component system, NtrC family, sensor kinase
VPSLFVIRGNDQGTRYELDEPVLKLGREPSNAVQIHDTEVSRHHAEIRRTDAGYAIADLNSSNGTFVNGRRVQEHLLASGDQVQLGSTLMLFTAPSVEGEDPSANVDIFAAEPPNDQSHIVHSVTQQEGSRFFETQPDLPQNSWLARARSNLQVMYRTALAVSHTLDIDQLLQRIMDLIFEWVEADRGCIMLLGADSKVLAPKVLRTRKGVRGDEKIAISKTILDYVTQRNEGVLTSNAREDGRWNPTGSILQLGIREAICVPMQGRYDMVGAIYIDTFTSPQEVVKSGGATKFSEDHLKLMIAIAHQAALAVEDTRYYSAMVQAERLAAIGQTIATVSHHIKNILQGIRGGSYLIEMGLSEHDESVVGKGWKIVEKNQNKISHLVMDMLTLSKDREPEMAPSDISRVVADVIELMQSRAAEAAVQLRWHPPESMPTLVFDPEGIHRAVLNVVTNAIDAAGENPGTGCVEVACRYDAQQAMLRVIVDDNGPGIPDDQRETLFSPFVSTKKSRGTGLGLPVSQKILNEHGGKILVESTPGKGCCFVLEWPAVAPAEAAPAAPCQTDPGL